MKKKILLISESMGGGLRKHLVDLINCLDKDEFDLYFIHGTKTLDGTFLSQYDNLHSKVKLIPCDSFEREIIPLNDLTTYKFITKKIQEIKPDIIHCHSSKAGVIGRGAAKRCGIKKIFYTPHAYSFLAPEFSEKSKKIFILIEKMLSRIATTKTFNVSVGEKQAALDNVIDKSRKFEVIHNGLPEIDLPPKEDVKKMLGLKFTDYVIGNNARLSEQKNPMLFMRIAKEVLKVRKDIHFVWAGDGPLFNEVASFIKVNNLENNVHLLGDRSDSELIVTGYNFFLITSLYEGLPYAPIEAMRAGVPIIGTNVVGINEVVINQKVGLLFDVSNFERDASCYIKSIDKMKFSSDSIKKTFKENFSLEVMKNKIENEYLKE